MFAWILWWQWMHVTLDLISELLNHTWYYNNEWDIRPQLRQGVEYSCLQPSSPWPRVDLSCIVYSFLRTINSGLVNNVSMNELHVCMIRVMGMYKIWSKDGHRTMKLNIQLYFLASLHALLNSLTYRMLDVALRQHCAELMILLLFKGNEWYHRSLS